MDDAFGVRVLTVEVSDRAQQVAVEEVDSGCEDTVVVIEPLTAEEWKTFSARFLFLSPPKDSFRSAELGDLLLDEDKRGLLYVCQPATEPANLALLSPRREAHPSARAGQGHIHCGHACRVCAGLRPQPEALAPRPRQTRRCARLRPREPSCGPERSPT